MNSAQYNSYLKHHGIKGQKWGVRRGPPYPIELPKNKKVTVKAGTEVEHQTFVKDFVLKDMPMFVASTEADKRRYREEYVKDIQRFMEDRGLSKQNLKSVVLRYNKDILAPSKNIQKQIYEDFYKEHKSSINKMVADMYKKVGENPNLDDTYDDFIGFISVPSSSKDFTKIRTRNKKLYSDFYSFVEKHGYNALLDIHDMNPQWGMGTRSPIIILKPLNDIGSVHIVNRI